MACVTAIRIVQVSHAHVISAEINRRCCNDALMVAHNVLLRCPLHFMLFSSVARLHHILESINWVSTDVAASGAQQQ